MTTRAVRALVRASVSSGCAFALAAGALAQDWPNWRGPSFDGSSPATGLPGEFDQEKNVRWATDLPGVGAGTPIVVGDRVFLTAADEGRDRLVALCLDRGDGHVRWSRDADSGYRAGGRGSRVKGGTRTTYASPSPVTDGERVVLFFGNGDLVAYDYEGEELWRRNIQQDYGDFAFLWTFSATPTLWQGRLYLPVLQRDVPVQRGRRRGGEGDEAAPDTRTDIESFVLVIDPANGKTLHRHVREAPALLEAREAYTTMIPFTGADGREELLLVGGDVITGHDPETTAELWRWGTWNPERIRHWRIVPSAVAGAGVVLVSAPKRAPVYAIRLGGEGELGAEAIAWQSEGQRTPVTSDVPTPAFAGGSFYVLSDMRAALSKVDGKDGAVRWTTPLPDDYLWRASPTVADGRIWCMNHNGEVFVVNAEDGAIVHRAKMGGEDDDQTRSTVVAAHGALFVRTNRRLFCVGK